MDWISIGVAAVLGAIGGLLGALVGRMFGSKSAGLVAAVVLIALSQQVNRSFVQPRLAPWRTEQALLGMPAYQAVKEIDPDTYDELLTIVNQGRRTGAAASEVMSDMQEIMNAKIPEYVAGGTDDAVIAYYESVVRRLEEIGQHNLQTCHRVAQGLPVGDIREYLSDETQQSAMDAPEALVLSTAEGASSSYGRNDAESDLSWVGSEVIENESDARLLQQKQGRVDWKRSCELHIALYETIMELEPNRSAGLLRYLASEQLAQR
jgi:hypothetical protein